MPLFLVAFLILAALAAVTALACLAAAAGLIFLAGLALLALAGAAYRLRARRAGGLGKPKILHPVGFGGWG